MKGIILAGGTGSRLFPSTVGVTKQLMPVYDKPLIYYPLSVLMLAGIKDILIVVDDKSINQFTTLLGDGSSFGISLKYAVQPCPRGLADAFIIGASFIGNDSVCLVLGDNIFYGSNLTSKIKVPGSEKKGATIFGYQVKDPESFGVIEFDRDQKVVSIEEKPKLPRSNFAATGLYQYDNDVVELAKLVKPSERGELEITSINNMYLEAGSLEVELLGRGFAWFDTGTPDKLLDASNFVQAIQRRQGYQIACLEEIAWNNGWIDESHLKAQGERQISSLYGQYILSLVEL